MSFQIRPNPQEYPRKEYQQPKVYPQADWSREGVVEYLRANWEKGESASFIRNGLHDQFSFNVTRNAVIGKATRLGLSSGKIKRTLSVRGPVTERPYVSPTHVRRFNAKFGNGDSVEDRQIKRRKPVPVLPGMPLDADTRGAAPRSRFVNDRTYENGRPVPSLPMHVDLTEHVVGVLNADHEERTCHWPVGEGIKCGREIYKGAYCMGHCMKGYAMLPSKKRNLSFWQREQSKLNRDAEV